VHYNHDFDDWEEVEILDVERNYNKRISEVHIKQVNRLNLQTDTDLLNHAYLPYLFSQQHINNNCALIV